VVAGPRNQLTFCVARRKDCEQVYLTQQDGLAEGLSGSHGPFGVNDVKPPSLRYFSISSDGVTPSYMRRISMSRASVSEMYPDDGKIPMFNSDDRAMNKFASSLTIRTRSGLRPRHFS
jgi:hypothetical protein